MPRTEYLVDLLASASIEAAGDHYVDVQRMTVGREVETAIFQHPSSRIVFAPLTLGEAPRLEFGCGIKDSASARIETEVIFSIHIRTGEVFEQVFETRLDPRARAADRRWQRHEVSLSRFEGRTVQLIFETTVPRRHSTRFAWAGWANPGILDHRRAPARVEPRPDHHPHIFLITADALAARYLECYGHASVKTPHLNRLAAEGVLFEQAWSQSCMTTGSYASILTGKYPHEHGIEKEWEPFPLHQLTLPVALQGYGYHTLLAASSLELADRASAIGRLFAETLPMLGNPMQDGTITTRHFTRWLETSRPDKPCFCWLHYFDTHPPTLPPEPFASMYYTGDPTDPQHSYMPEQVAEIRGVESAMVLRKALPLMERGEPVYEVIEILRDTAAVLKGQRELRPDLAEHLIRMGARAMQGLAASQFGDWLDGEVREMADRGRVSAKLLQWMKETLRLLEQTESDIIWWMRGAVDFRFPLSVYLGTVSYFDAHVGALVAALKEQGLYDQSLIVVTAPHGEVLENETLPFHHFMLAPDTLHVPLIMKLPESTERAGLRLDGVFELIDLFPTVLEIQGIHHNYNLQGVSRFSNIRDHVAIPAHDSFATGFHSVAHSLLRPPHLLVRERPGRASRTFHTLLSGGHLIAYDMRSGELRLPEQIEDSEEMRARLEAWQLLA